MLHVRFWGTRGSIPSPGPATIRYGGNTPCVELRTDHALAILDAGTGIRALGTQLLAETDGPLSADVYLTHAHWDHIQGLPFFAPLFGAEHRFRIWSAAGLRERIERALRAQMAPDVFPVPFDEVRAALEFRAVDDPCPAAPLEVRAHGVRHPGGALGYRIAPRNRPEAAIVYIPDNELHPAAPYSCPADWRSRLVDFTAGAAMLVHDSMYSTAESERHRGWGHSSIDEAVDLALDAGVPRLVLFHHHPERSDAAVDELVRQARARAADRGATLEILAAAEGQHFTL